LRGDPVAAFGSLSVSYRKDMQIPFGKLTAKEFGETSRRTRMTDMPGDEWKELAEAARDEQDPKKLMHLIDRLNRALEEHVKHLYPRSEEAAN